MLLLYLTVGFLSFFVLNSSLAKSGSDVVVDGNCKQQLEEFADSISNFTRCAVNQASPFKFCRLCYEQFDDVRRIKICIYKKKNGCVKELVESERYQIVSHAYDFAKRLWEGSNCYNCYSSHNEDEDNVGSEWNMKPKVTVFFHKQTILNHCFKNYSRIPVNPIANRTATNTSSTNTSSTNLTIDIHSICRYCQPYYNDMKHSYKSLIEDVGGYEKENLLCADVLSAMNGTRQKWSTTFDCVMISLDTVSVVALTCFFCFLPVVFYSAAKFHGDSNNKKSSHNAIPRIRYDAE